MKSFLRLSFFIGFIALSSVVSANPCDDGGIGGTGIQERSSGIDGTGSAFKNGGIGGTGSAIEKGGIGGSGDKVKDGIGGTGISNKEEGIGGTGILGVITGFGSICVNRLEVHYSKETPVKMDGQKISSTALEIGQVVAVKATGNERSLTAKEIHVYHQVSGPISEFNPARGQLKVMNQTVFVNSTRLKGLQVGQWVKVSGLRKANGSVLATRIDHTAEKKVAQTVGNLRQQGKNHFIGGTKIEGLTDARNLAKKDVRLTGTWDGRAFRVRDIKPGPVSDLIRKVEVFHIQGITSGRIVKGHLKVDGLNVAVTGQTKVIGKRTINGSDLESVIVRGQIKEGKPTAGSVEKQPTKEKNGRQNGALNELSHALSLSNISEKLAKISIFPIRVEL